MAQKVDHVIKLKLNEIKYDVKFDTWHKGDATEKEIAYDNDDAEDWLCRQIDSAIADIEAELNWAVCKAGQGKAQTNALDDVPEEWTVHLRFSPSWLGSIRAMNSMAHRYVVAKVLYRWYLSADLRQQASDQLAEAEHLLEQIYHNARNERVSLKPFRL